ncbi:MAG: transposase [Anaerolineales bacterium]
MNPEQEFCPNEHCPDRGKVGEGNSGVHSQKEQRCRCRTCGKTFSIRKGTAMFGIKHAVNVFVIVVTLLAFVCPVQASVMAFGLDERTVRRWQLKAGDYCQAIHKHVVGNSQLDLQQVQADEIKVKTQKGTLWMAMALMVSTRLWRGGVVSTKRDKHLIRALAAQNDWAWLAGVAGSSFVCVMLLRRRRLRSA